MAWTVGDIAAMTRISVRTLHHYDEIGLVRPSGRSASGYRLYDRQDLERLQLVLFHRALGMPLEAIARVLEGGDRKALLLSQREKIAERRDELEAMLALIDRTIASLEGGATMKSEDLFEGFDPARHEAEAEQRWGGTPAYQESKRRTARYGEAEWAAIRAEGDAATRAFADLMAAGVAPDDARTRAAVDAHRAHIDRWFYPCSGAMQRNLAAMYVADERFTATYDRYRPGLAVYVRDAILAHAPAA